MAASEVAEDSAAPAGGVHEAARRLEGIGRERWLWIVVLAMPWSWFLLRDRFPVMDLVNIGLPLLVAIGIIAIVGFWVFRPNRLAVIAAVSWVCFGMVAIVLPWRPVDRPAPALEIDVASINVNGVWFERQSVALQLFERNPDVIVTVETNKAAHDAVARLLPHSLLSSGQAAPGFVSKGLPRVGVYSLHNIEPLDPPPDMPIDFPGMRVRIDHPDAPFILYALHLPRQWPRVAGSGYEVSFSLQRQIVESLADSIAAEELPVVVAGDLNLHDRSWGYRRLTAELDDAMKGNWLGPTSQKQSLLWRSLFLRIDHLLVDKDWCSSGGDRFGATATDHLGIEARVGPCEI